MTPQIPNEVLKSESMAVQVLRFMYAFDQMPNVLSQPASEADLMLGNKLMEEEINEMWTGWMNFRESRSLENLTEFVDGAIDTIYVILWTLNKLGVPADACFAEVQRSNMAKLHDGKVVKNEYGKVQKPASWTPPDLFGILMAARDNAVYLGGMRK